MGRLVEPQVTAPELENSAAAAFDRENSAWIVSGSCSTWPKLGTRSTRRLKRSA